ncbi:hypothetical protein JEQ12_020653 [Ovis aries]|uniref:Uncharacterized protein n=1 Tax=Ovis aries TaxID=9940 RepID=A0A836CNQ2_SHEEP|nr:hypothetical protein JEQ12_020653 [Ovis aries]
MRQKKRNGSLPDCPPPEDPAIAQLLQKLLSQEFVEVGESRKCRNCSKYQNVYFAHRIHYLNEYSLDFPGGSAARKHVKQDSNVSEEWKSMFGSLEPPSMQQALPKGSDQAVMPAGKPPRSESSAAICVLCRLLRSKNTSGKKSPKFTLCEKCHDLDIFEVPELTNVQNKKPTVQVFSGTILPSTSQIQITTCKAELSAAHTAETGAVLCREDS